MAKRQPKNPEIPGIEVNGGQFVSKLAELAAEGFIVETVARGKRNSEWIIRGRHAPLVEADLPF